MAKAKQATFQPEQLDSINKGVSTLAFILISIIGIRYIAQDILGPILLSIFLAVLILPIFKWYRNKGISGGWSITLTILTFFGGAVGIILFLSASFKLLFDSLSQYTEAIQASLMQLSSQVNVSEDITTNITSNITAQNIESLLSVIVSSFGNIVTYFILVPILAIFMVLQADSFPKDVSKSLAKDNPNIKRFKKFADSIVIYVSNRFKVNAVTGTLFGASLFILGVDFAVVWGLLTVIMSFIPYIGLAIAAIPPILIAFANGGIVSAVLVIISVAVINLLAENVLEPKLQGQSNKISTATVIISLVFWVWLFGGIGAILAVPMTVLLKMILEDFKETHFLALLMEGNYSGEDIKKDKNSFLKYFDKTISKIPGGNGKKSK